MNEALVKVVSFKDQGSLNDGSYKAVIATHCFENNGQGVRIGGNQLWSSSSDRQLSFELKLFHPGNISIVVNAYLSRYSFCIFASFTMYVRVFLVHFCGIESKWSFRNLEFLADFGLEFWKNP